MFAWADDSVKPEENKDNTNATTENTLDGQKAEVEEQTEEQVVIAAITTDDSKDQEVIRLDSFMNLMNWENSSSEHRRQVFAKIKQLKDALKQQRLEELKNAYESAKANEQSLENRLLTAASVATIGIGGMELAMGLSQQKADKAAEQDMNAYISSFRCEYGDGKQVKAGPEEIELPGGNDETLLKYRNEYIALAADLKERKEALGMKPGIESEEILDKSEMGLYDQENMGIDSGAYSSLYRAKMLDSEEDQAKIDEEKAASKKRVIAGGVLVGAGVIGSIIGNMAINGDKYKKNQETLEKRNDIEEEISDMISYELDDCNAKIKEAKDWAEAQKQTKDYSTNSELQEEVKQVESLQYLIEESDIYKLEDHPICY